MLKNCKAVGVMDRDVAFGTGGIVYQDVCRSMMNGAGDVRMQNFILGIGGRDITPVMIEKCFDNLISNDTSIRDDVFWPGENTELWNTWKGDK